MLLSSFLFFQPPVVLTNCLL